MSFWISLKTLRISVDPRDGVMQSEHYPEKQNIFHKNLDPDTKQKNTHTHEHTNHTFNNIMIKTFAPLVKND